MLLFITVMAFRPLIGIGAGLLIAGIVSAVLSATTGIISTISNKKNVQATNEFNQAQYEDWKAYTDYQSTLTRSQKAGVSPWAALGDVSAPSQPFQIGDAGNSNAGIFDNLANMFQNLGSSYTGAVTGQMKKDQFEADKAFNKSMIELKEEAASQLQEYRNAQHELQQQLKEQKDYWNAANFRWRNDYYLDPRYPGYWTGHIQSQNYMYNYQRYPLELQQKFIETMYSEQAAQDRHAESVSRRKLDEVLWRLRTNQADMSDLDYIKRVTGFDIENDIYLRNLQYMNDYTNVRSNPILMYIDAISGSLSSIFNTASQGMNIFDQGFTLGKKFK